jgi:hypothetical protein
VGQVKYLRAAVSSMMRFPGKCQLMFSQNNNVILRGAIDLPRRISLKHYENSHRTIPQIDFMRPENHSEVEKFKKHRLTNSCRNHANTSENRFSPKKNVSRKGAVEIGVEPPVAP